MYSEFFDQLGGGGGLPGRRANANASASSGPSRPPALVSFKAGKMNMEPIDPDASEKKFRCEPDTRRGEIRLVYQTASSDAATTNGLYWQWYDRRDDSLVDSKQITTAGSTWEKVELPPSKKHARDRVYVWTQQDGTYDMFWMQDASEEKDDELVVQVNQYLADPASAAPVGATTETTNATPSASSGAAGGATTTSSGAGGGTDNPPSQSQVDALSNILQNLGMPQSEGASGGAEATAATGGGAGGGMLTLADLQSAMTGIQQQQPSPAMAPLSEVVTPTAVSSLLENEGARERLMALLPEEQRSAEYLEENLRSPQVQQTLRALTQALLPDDAGNMDSFYSVLANFSLDPADGQQAMASNNPIQAFLDCILASTKKEDDEDMAETKEDE
mmetsp:Transcript_13873/g.26610  ORF Transcript_13873/g.26610 Transcript_13873/m.26610 type:complete len:390 (+) Transcript_13873:21-1190(+)|eukprot:scaffold6655_cov169-Amphora_coffeaeformis.AAC.25